MRGIINVALITIIFVGCYLINYNSFYCCLSDDVEFNYGKKRMRNRRKKNKGFWKKFFFFDIKNEVIKWHYHFFLINFLSFIPTLISFNLFVLTKTFEAKISILIFGGIYLLTAIPIAFSRWNLYKGNMVRSKEKYRKNNRK